MFPPSLGFAPDQGSYERDRGAPPPTPSWTAPCLMGGLALRGLTGVPAGPRDQQWGQMPCRTRPPASLRGCCPLELQSLAWHHPPSPTFSLWMSLLIWEILIFMASSSSSSTRGMLGAASESSTVWKLRSVSGMYHLQSYCCVLLGGGRGRLTG